MRGRTGICLVSPEGEEMRGGEEGEEEEGLNRVAELLNVVYAQMYLHT